MALVAVVPVAARQGRASTYPATRLDVRHAVAVLRVTAENRPDISVEISNPGSLPAPTVSVSGDQVLVDGGLEDGILSCNARLGRFEVTVRGRGTFTEGQVPVITAHVPRDVHVGAGGAVLATIGPSASAVVRMAGCGRSDVGDVTGALTVAATGSGTVRAGSAASASVSATGSGATSLENVGGRLQVSLSGSGNVAAATLRGPLEVHIAGSGNVAVRGGSVTDAAVDIAGSGDADIQAPVEHLRAKIAGSGNVRAQAVRGAVEQHIVGSGRVDIGR